MTLEEALAFERQLSPVDKARLIERMVPDIERELRAARSAPYVSLRGLWRGLGITGKKKDQARQESGERLLVGKDTLPSRTQVSVGLRFR